VIKWLRKQVHGTRYESDDSLDDSIDQAVLIRIFTNTSPMINDIFDDLAKLEDEIQDLLGIECEVDGHDIGKDDAIVYIYGQSAESIFEVIRPYLLATQLTAHAEITLRYGPPGSSQKLVQLPQ
jgi:hypothetical protein